MKNKIEGIEIKGLVNLHVFVGENGSAQEGETENE